MHTESFTGSSLPNLQNDCHIIWEKCLRIIRERIDEQTFQTWFEPIIPVKLSVNELTIQVPNQFFYEWLEEHFVHLLRQAIDATIGKEGLLKYYINLEKNEEELDNQKNSSLFKNFAVSKDGNSRENYFDNSQIKVNERRFSYKYEDFKLNNRYNFDNFVEGDCNRFARSTGFSVAQRPGYSSFNPLMFYGGVGLGKTHLVQAIGNYVMSRMQNPQPYSVLYVPSEKFTTQFIEYVRNNELSAFNAFYTKVDVLLIDDVQFFAGKEKTQDIFFHIFNQMHQDGKQIIMTSDCPPKELTGLEERLISRFKWGVTADLKQPDLETRIAIIQKKLQYENVSFNDDVIEYLANSIDSNVREIEGAIVSLIAQSNINKLPINVTLAKAVVQQIVQSTQNKEISIDEIQRIVSEYLGISVEDMKSKNRKKEMVLARQIAMFLCKNYTDFSLKSIGYHFGSRDHSTVIHAITCIEDYLKERKEIKIYVDDIKQKLKK